MRNDALILQTAFSANPRDKYSVPAGLFWDMLRLCFPRHAAYARAHCFDYWPIFGDIHPEHPQPGGWSKIHLIKDALEVGYEYIAYIDTDAVIWNMDCDLRDALPEGASIGAVMHDPATSPYLQSVGAPAHYNVGVLYVRNGPGVIDFFDSWIATYPGHSRWLEQGSFNELVVDNPLFTAVDDTWNATVNVNMVARPNVYAWHGVFPYQSRLVAMQNALRDDHLRFRV
jgi:hypothetical protein